MLYDILPPLFLFASLGGIILVVSRVVLRMRRQKLSHEIQSVATATEGPVDNKIFQPGKKGVTLVKNRLALIPHMLKSTIENVQGGVQDWAHRRQERKAEKQAAKKAGQRGK
jgi:hypothetical protein